MSGKAYRPGNDFSRFRKEEIEQSIPDRFEQQVRNYSDRPAVRTSAGTASYRFIHALSNRISSTLLAQQGEGEEPVALLIEKGTLMVAAIMAVLKAGKFYLALDSMYPHSRNMYMLEDSKASLILTEAKNHELAQKWMTGGRRVMTIEDLPTGISDENVSLKLQPDTLACIFYTSGSTKAPKGVVDNHRNVLHNIMRYTNSLHIRSEDRLTLIQSFCFSGTVSSLFGALMNGAAACLFNLQKEGIDALADWMVSEGITIYHSVPVIFERLMSCHRRFPALRLIRIEGDQALKKHVDLYKNNFQSDCVLVNGLGATETGLSRQYFIHPGTVLPDIMVPVGYAVEDMEVLLIDENGKEVETGATGQIAIRSQYLAKGYWRREDLTREIFKEDTQKRGFRIYRTGDVGRFLPDGCLQYLGRRDFQVKIRGQWVETGGIEDVLNNSDGIREAVVLARGDGTGDMHLVAYLVPSGLTRTSISSLRQVVREHFPDYMVPSRFVFVDALPYTSDGKLDRQALPAPDQLRPDLDAEFVSPRSQTEKTIAHIWREVLKITEIGIHDDFLELGGDSIMAWQILSRIRNAFSVEIPLKGIFDQSTIAGQAGCIDNMLRTDRGRNHSV